MAEVKNTAPFPVCLPTGRALGLGETADVDLTDDQVNDLVTLGHLTPVQANTADAPAPKSRTAKEPA